MSEKNDYKLLRKHLGRCHLERIENMAGVGTPDVFYCIDGVMGWIEMKSPIEPKRKTSRLLTKHTHQLLQSQKNWFLSLRNAGGKGWILISTDRRWLLISSTYADDINHMNMEELIDVCSWYCDRPVTITFWDLLRRKLTE